MEVPPAGDTGTDEKCAEIKHLLKSTVNEIAPGISHDAEIQIWKNYPINSTAYYDAVKRGLISKVSEDVDTFFDQFEINKQYAKLQLLKNNVKDNEDKWRPILGDVEQQSRTLIANALLYKKKRLQELIENENKLTNQLKNSIEINRNAIKMAK